MAPEQPILDCQGHMTCSPAFSGQRPRTAIPNDAQRTEMEAVFQSARSRDSFAMPRRRKSRGATAYFS